jgi:outer membrane protein OmpA-like peptidoglycan-associated protein
VRAIILPCLLASLAVSGCATKKYVSREVGEVNQKVDSLSTEVEKTQERVKRNEVRIDEVNSQAQSGITEAKGSAQQAMTKAQEAEKAAKGKIIYTVTLSNDKVTFPVNRAEVSDDAKKMIDEAIAQLKAENKGVYFEIEGHTDASGPEEYNLKLGEDRAMAVRNYLHDAHGIALNRMQVISYGETKPVVDNKTKDNRAQNRRVVIKVLE